MRSQFIGVAAVVIGLVTAGCGASDAPLEDPERVVRPFQRDLRIGKPNAACSAAFLTQAYYERLRGPRLSARCGHKLPRRLGDAAIEDVEINGETAQVTVSGPEARLQMRRVDMPFSETVDPPAQVWRIDAIEFPAE